MKDVLSYLLEHLVDVAEGCSVEIAVAIAFEAVCE